MAPSVEYNEKLDVITKEVIICKQLTSNDLKVRKRGIVSLKKWFPEIGKKGVVDENDYNRIWSGLFYCVWMSDKPLVQEETIESISSLIHSIDDFQNAMYFVRGFFSSLAKQWDRISHYRIDKFLMFVRRFVRQILMLLKHHDWDSEKLESCSQELYLAMQVLPYSLAVHLTEIFNEELAKISKGSISTDSLVLLLKGFMECIFNLRPNMQIVNSVNCNIFGGLARQLKLYIKQKAVADDCDDIQDENSEPTEIALDPRPGGVDVYLPFIDFNENKLMELIERYRCQPGSIKAKNILAQMNDMFRSITKLRTIVLDPKMLTYETSLPKSLKRKKTEKLETENDNEASHKKDPEWITVPSETILELASKCSETLNQEIDIAPEEEKKTKKPRTKKVVDSNDTVTTRVLRAKKTEPKLELLKIEEPSTPRAKKSQKKIEEPSTPRSKKTEPKIEEPSTPRSKKTEPKIEEPSTPRSKKTELKIEEPSTPRTRSRKLALDPVEVTEPEVKRSRRLREKQETVVERKSMRIAERQKKVHFKLEENISQDITTYRKLVTNKPEIPFDGSKMPAMSILKPCAVGSPINPFYFSNGKIQKSYLT